MRHLLRIPFVKHDLRRRHRVALARKPGIARGGMRGFFNGLR
ncbi:hypothetical protein LMG3441_03019 [Achromobacter kerstersii]|uniref:Uncharacterized protein n=1 Tax=Achromobacter kerstersii TaxID=1353890 RepID=A0A6S7AYM7_9BURK|nr:hypothetical protein LMG3441_03019 [Achromobacter kerstersii]